VAVVGWLEALMDEDVLPVVAEVIGVQRGRRVPAPLIEEFRQGHLPARHNWTLFRVIVGGNAKGHDVSLGGVEQTELMEVVVERAHRILDSNVQVPKRVLPGHLNAAPDERGRIQRTTRN
jgi:hypothetical protein